MRIIYYLTFGFGIFFVLIEYLRGGVSYFAVNAITMIEDYLMGIIMISVALLYRSVELQAK